MKVDFFIVGSPKAGTTSLYHYLNEHPQVEMSSQKEPNYFSDLAIQHQQIYYYTKRVNQLERYHELFKNKSQNMIFGEGSVSYLFYKNVAADIKEYNPKAKIIIMLRNPIDRAFSHYLMDYRLGFVTESFEDIINKKSSHKNAHLFYQQYIEVSQYTKQIERYIKEFNIHQILFIDYEDFKDDAGKVVKRVYNFLGIESGFKAEINKKYNTFTMPNNKCIRFLYSFIPLRKSLSYLIPQVVINSINNVFFKKDKQSELLSNTRKQLKQFFSEDVKALSLLLNKDFSKWIK